MKTVIYFSFLLFSASIQAQDNSLLMDTLPYFQIPEYPASYNQHTTVARMIDGLGYRYHWATRELRKDDLAFLPGNDGQNCRTVCDHILGLTHMMLNALHQRPHKRLEGVEDMPFEEVRRRTLENLWEASTLLKKEKTPLAESKIIFERGDNRREMEFWHIINGPLADALYHTGQIVSYRRSAGNPIDPNVSVFMGRTMEE